MDLEEFHKKVNELWGECFGGHNVTQKITIEIGDDFYEVESLELKQLIGCGCGYGINIIAKKEGGAE